MGSQLQLADSLGLAALNIPRQPDCGRKLRRSAPGRACRRSGRTSAARRTLSAIRYENLPNLSVNGAYVESGRETGTLAGTYNVQLVINVPILDGFRRQTRSEQRPRVDIAAAPRAGLGNRVETDARQSILDLASAGQQVAIAEHGCAWPRGVLAGAGTFPGRCGRERGDTNAQSSVISARDALIQAHVNYGTARIATYRALGVLDQDPLTSGRATATRLNMTTEWHDGHAPAAGRPVSAPAPTVTPAHQPLLIVGTWAGARRPGGEQTVSPGIT